MKRAAFVLVAVLVRACSSLDLLERARLRLGTEMHPYKKGESFYRTKNASSTQESLMDTARRLAAEGKTRACDVNFDAGYDALPWLLGSPNMTVVALLDDAPSAHIVTAMVYLNREYGNRVQDTRVLEDCSVCYNRTEVVECVPVR